MILRNQLLQLYFRIIFVFLIPNKMIKENNLVIQLTSDSLQKYLMILIRKLISRIYPYDIHKHKI